MLKKISEDFYFDFTGVTYIEFCGSVSLPGAANSEYKILFHHASSYERALYASADNYQSFRDALEEHLKPPTLAKAYRSPAEVLGREHVPYPDPKMRLKTPDEHEF